MAEALERLVVQVDVRELDVVLVERVRIDREPVILRRNLHAAGPQIFHRMIAASMSELQLVGSAPQRKTQQLLTEADAEHGTLPDDLPNVLLAVVHGLRTPRAFRELHSV